MRLVTATAFAFAGALSLATLHAQQQPPAAGGQRMGGMQMPDTARKVENGGIHAPGWQGKPDEGAGPGESVTQTIAMSVKGDNVECAINGTTVATYPKSAVVGDGKLTSTDGVAGIRVAHNVDVIVKDFKVTK